MNEEEKIIISINEEDAQNIINCYEKDLKELNQLQNNWNELKNWLEEEYKYIPHTYCRMFQKILNKMQELEGVNGRD